MEIFVKYWPLIFSGLLVTIRICIIAIGLGVIAGLGIALLRRVKLTPVNWCCKAYIELFRGTPFLIQLFLLYYVAPNFGLMLEPELAGIVGLTLYGAAYFAEIFRSGLESIPKGQVEAAASLGIGRMRTFRKIIFPQLTVLIMPPSINQAITLLKDSAILSIITVPELTKITTRIINESFATTEPLIILGLLYWMLAEIMSFAGARLERRFTRYLRPTTIES